MSRRETDEAVLARLFGMGVNNCARWVNSEIRKVKNHKTYALTNKYKWQTNSRSSLFDNIYSDNFFMDKE